jgi:hypothetical protein
VKSFALWLALTIWFAAVCVFAPGAPAPTPKKHATSLMVGEWEHGWESEKYRVTFNRDGTWAAYEHGGADSRWSGTWELDGLVLTVREARVTDLRELVWRVTLSKSGESYVGTADVLELPDGKDPSGRTAEVSFANKR